MELLDKKFVHKNKNENVFIYNLRRILPYKIDANVFEYITNNLSKDEQNYVLDYYALSKNKHHIFYTLRTIPCFINISGQYVNSMLVTKDILELILKNYNRVSESNEFVLSDKISEIDELVISKALKFTSRAISDAERVRLAGLLERIDALQKRDIFYANMYVDTSHNYFFEHYNEHVPGMMIVEAARQMGICCYHIYGNVPIDAKFLISEMESKFYRYTELSFAVKMELRNNFITNQKHLFWSTIDGFVNFYQNNNLVAHTLVRGKCVTGKAFEKIKKTRSNILETYSFIPRSKQYCNIYAPDCSSKHTCTLMEITIKSLILETKKNFDSSTDLTFEISFDAIGNIQGKCLLTSVKKKGLINICEFKIIQIDVKAIKNLQEAIKNYFYAKEDVI